MDRGGNDDRYLRSALREDTITFVVTDSIYIQLVPWAYASVSGPTFICPGDTVPLVLECTGRQNILWQGIGQQRFGG
jgi:hypothetical protein